ncbi:MAG: excisionase family DNA-binding protein [Acidobacteria bacterium]|nr:excisionase family DNA-binding protein [Acidobacteriota bacterium]
MSKRSAAAYCDLGVKKIETAIRLGQVRAYSVGKKILLRRSELDAWIQAGEVTRAPEPQKTDLQDLVGRAIATARSRRGDR